MLAFAREGYRKTDFRAADLFDALTYGGLWRFLRKYPSMCWYELRRSFSRELFCRSLQRLVPEIEAGDLTTGGAGVRAQAISPEGDLIQDFQFLAGRNACVLNAPSLRPPRHRNADEIVTRCGEGTPIQDRNPLHNC